MKVKDSKVFLPVVEPRSEAPQIWLFQFPRYPCEALSFLFENSPDLNETNCLQSKSQYGSIPFQCSRCTSKKIGRPDAQRESRKFSSVSAQDNLKSPQLSRPFGTHLSDDLRCFFSVPSNRRSRVPFGPAITPAAHQGNNCHSRSIYNSSTQPINEQCIESYKDNSLDWSPPLSFTGPGDT